MEDVKHGTAPQIEDSVGTVPPSRDVHAVIDVVDRDWAHPSTCLEKQSSTIFLLHHSDATTTCEAKRFPTEALEEKNNFLNNSPRVYF